MLKTLLVALLVLGAVFVFRPASPRSEVQPTPTISTPTSDNSPRYLPYSSSALDQNQDSRRVLFFYATWCPTCRPIDKLLSENQSKLPTDVFVIRVNYNDPDTDDSEKELARKYAVTYQHTFVQIDSAGQEVAKWNGGGLTELLANLK